MAFGTLHLKLDFAARRLLCGIYTTPYGLTVGLRCLEKPGEKKCDQDKHLISLAV